MKNMTEAHVLHVLVVLSVNHLLGVFRTVTSFSLDDSFIVTQYVA